LNLFFLFELGVKVGRLFFFFNLNFFLFERAFSRNFQHSIACRQLKAPQGLLGGIGRRMSSLLWGGISTSTTIESVSSNLGPML
jgi:hypothetical protein